MDHRVGTGPNGGAKSPLCILFTGGLPSVERQYCIYLILVQLLQLYNTLINFSDFLNFIQIIAYWYCKFNFCSSYVFILFYFIFFLWRLLVLYFTLVAPAIFYLFFLHVVLYVFLANK